jgi:hypothetical protein
MENRRSEILPFKGPYQIDPFKKEETGLPRLIDLLRAELKRESIVAPTEHPDIVIKCECQKTDCPHCYKGAKPNGIKY